MILALTTIVAMCLAPVDYITNIDIQFHVHVIESGLTCSTSN